VILVTIGTSEPFDRLLASLDHLPNGERLVVQTGASTVRPEGAECIDYLAFDHLMELVRDARIVICHAGVGTTLAVLALGKRPIVVPRVAKYGEAVDDHQLEFGQRLAAAGLVTLVQDPASLREDVLSPDSSELPAQANKTGGLVGELRRCLVEHAGRAAA
jgi:exopolysaccharide biosynthesis glucuronosyltransferase PssE